MEKRNQRLRRLRDLWDCNKRYIPYLCLQSPRGEEKESKGEKEFKEINLAKDKLTDLRN